MAAKSQEWLVPVTISEERVVTVKARTKEEARERVEAGRYTRLGRSMNRGFLIVGVPRLRDEDA